jgi:WD40 repeat protein
MPALVDQFCPNVHDAPITAACFDPASGTIATADAAGLVAIQRPGEATPQLTFRPGLGVRGALDLISGGTLVAVGDEGGTIGVYRTDSGEPVFVEAREGPRGQVRAFRGVAINAQASRLASISRDNLIRIWDLTHGERITAWQGFSGDTVEFDPRGERLLAMDSDGQPKMMDLMRVEALHMDRLQTPAEQATFTRDGTMVVAAGPSGISLLRVADGALVHSFATRGGSGIIRLVLSPDGTQAGAVTRRSVHIFSLPDLTPVESRPHGAPNPTGAALWASGGIRVAGDDGLMHSGGSGSAGPVTVTGGFGDHRVAVHSSTLAYWHGSRRQVSIDAETVIREVHVDRDGRLLVAVPRQGPIQVYNCQSGRKVFDGGPETSGTIHVGVGGAVVAVQQRSGGCRWWDLENNRGFELKWPRAMALSNGGTWLGVVTPRGFVRILDPMTGKDAIQPPRPLAEVAVVTMAFVNRRPDLLILDEDGVLGHYDLADSVRTRRPAEGRDVITINVPVDRIWGITGGQYCAMRLPEGPQCSILWVDIHACEVVHEVTGLDANAWVDAENGLILEPARSSAILEREMDGSERRVLRALPDSEWISFGWRGIIEASEHAAEGL